jgi:hypothetical protein
LPETKGQCSQHAEPDAIHGRHPGEHGGHQGRQPRRPLIRPAEPEPRRTARRDVEGGLLRTDVELLAPSAPHRALPARRGRRGSRIPDRGTPRLGAERSRVPRGFGAPRGTRACRARVTRVAWRRVWRAPQIMETPLSAGSPDVTGVPGPAALRSYADRDFEPPLLRGQRCA